MDEAVHRLERRFRAEGDAESFLAWLGGLARSGREGEALRLAAQGSFALAELRAEPLGSIDGFRDLFSDTDDPTEHRVRLLGWRLPPELGSAVLLEVLRGRRARRVAHLPRGSELRLGLTTRSGDAVEGTETEVSVEMGVAGAYRQVLSLVDSAARYPEWACVFRTLADAAGATLQEEARGWLFMD